MLKSNLISCSGCEHLRKYQTQIRNRALLKTEFFCAMSGETVGRVVNHPFPLNEKGAEKYTKIGKDCSIYKEEK